MLPRLNAIEMASTQELEKGIHLLSDAELGKLSNILINEYERRPISQTKESEQETNWAISYFIYIPTRQRRL